MTLGGWGSVVGALVATLGALAMAARLLRALQGRSVRGPGVPLQVLQRTSLSPKQGVALVQVADRVLVVSMADNGMSLLTELSGDALAQALAPRRSFARAAALVPAAELAPGARKPASWLARVPALARFVALAALLGALPLTARAQTASPARAGAPAASAPASAVPQAAAKSAPLATPAPARASASGIALPRVQGPFPPKVDLRLGEGPDSFQLSGAVGIVVLLGALTLLPALFLLMTSFTRILIVLHFLRSALGTQTTPPGQLLTAIAVLLTGVVMNPVLQETNRVALQPYFHGEIQQGEAYQRAVQPFRRFMLANTRDRDLTLFTDLSGARNAESVDQIPTVTMVSAFVTSELRTAFQMGFAIFLPFVVVDLIVASVLMSLGMFMLPPVMISLPFKLLLFVLADGWTLVVQNLVSSFKVAG